MLMCRLSSLPLLGTSLPPIPWERMKTGQITTWGLWASWHPNGSGTVRSLSCLYKLCFKVRGWLFYTTVRRSLPVLQRGPSHSSNVVPHPQQNQLFHHQSGTFTRTRVTRATLSARTDALCNKETSPKVTHTSLFLRHPNRDVNRTFFVYILEKWHRWSLRESAL